jgi:iron complex outermembrane recepter protein
LAFWELEMGVRISHPLCDVRFSPITASLGLDPLRRKEAMTMHCRRWELRSVSSLAVLAASLFTGGTAFAQSEPSEASVEANVEPAASADIIVTAQKRSERINDIGMSITAQTGEELRESGVRSIDDFSKVDTSFTSGLSLAGTPNYTIRGVGYFDFSLAAPPTVSVYVDEVPLAYSALTKGVTLGLERVEILKGPQGTLYGQNSTGGAINFIAAKPTSSFEAGMEASLGRFSALNLNGYVSGPITETLGARLSATTDRGGAWQQSYTRDEEHGDRRFTAARLLLEWAPTERLLLSVNLNGWRDRSDTQAGQLTGFPLPAALTDPSRNVQF